MCHILMSFKLKDGLRDPPKVKNCVKFNRSCKIKTDKGNNCNVFDERIILLDGRKTVEPTLKKKHKQKANIGHDLGMDVDQFE